MKYPKLLTAVRILLCLALFIADVMLMVRLNLLTLPQTALIVCIVLTLVLMMGLLSLRCVFGKRAGYRPVFVNLLLFTIVMTGGKRRVVPFWKGRTATLIIPEKPDASLPWKAAIAAPLAATAIAAAALWSTGWLIGGSVLGRAALLIAALLTAGLSGLLWPAANQSDALTLLLTLRRDETRFAWQCSGLIFVTLMQSSKVADLPEEWFPEFPSELADNQYVANVMLTGSSRLIRLFRFEEAYRRVTAYLPRIDQPTRDQEEHMTRACFILNGALCEAALGLEANCLNRLDHPAVQFMLPHSWKSRLALAKYARALRIDPRIALEPMPDDLAQSIATEPPELVEHIRMMAAPKEDA